MCRLSPNLGTHITILESTCPTTRQQHESNEAWSSGIRGRMTMTKTRRQSTLCRKWKHTGLPVNSERIINSAAASVKEAFRLSKRAVPSSVIPDYVLLSSMNRGQMKMDFRYALNCASPTRAPSHGASSSWFSGSFECLFWPTTTNTIPPTQGKGGCIIIARQNLCAWCVRDSDDASTACVLHKGSGETSQDPDSRR